MIWMYEWHFIIISFNNTPVFGVFIARDWIRQWNMYTHTIRNEKKILWERDKRYKHRSKQMHCIYFEMAHVLQSVCAYPSKRMHGDSGVSVCTGEWLRNMRWKMEMDKRLLSIRLFVFSSLTSSSLSLLLSTYACILKTENLSTEELVVQPPG